MLTPYYEDACVTIYHADSREVMFDVAPPYGIGWSRGIYTARGSKAQPGIAGDDDTAARDAALAFWGNRPAVVFGSPSAPPPSGLTQTLIWHKPADAGLFGARTGFRRDIEAIYLCGTFPKRDVEWSSIIRSTIPMVGGTASPAGRWGHPHAKPLDLMARLIELAPGTIIDPFMGSGSTLAAAKQLGRVAVGIEIEESHCETAAKRCAQECLDLEAA